MSVCTGFQCLPTGHQFWLRKRETIMNSVICFLLLVFFRDFQSDPWILGILRWTYLVLVSLGRESIDSCRQLYQKKKKVNLLLPLKYIIQTHIESEIFLELTLKYSSPLGKQVHRLSLVTRQLDVILHVRNFKILTKSYQANLKSNFCLSCITSQGVSH